MKKIKQIIEIIGLVILIIGLCAADSDNLFLPVALIVIGGCTMYLCDNEKEK